MELPFQQDIIHTLRNTYSINILREGKRNPLFSNISLGIINRTFLKKKQRNRVCNAILHMYYMLYLSSMRSYQGEILTNKLSLQQQHIRVDKTITATNDIKMSRQILTGTWPTPQNRKQQYLKFRLGT